jgi:hypothetical protein
MMKTLRFSIALLLVAAMFTPTETSAQTVVGVKAGIGIANLSLSESADELNLSSRTTFTGGGFATFGLGEMFFLQPEVLYAPKGAKGDIEGVEATFALDYIEIPVLFGAAFDLGGSSVKPRVFAGPSVAFEIGCDVSGTESGVSVSFECSEIELETKSVDFGLVFGAGVAFPLGSVQLIIDGRYDLGLSDINDFEGDTESIKNKAWQFMAGVGFPIG